jgi:hypothetical protein
MALVHGTASTRHPAAAFAALTAPPKGRFRKPHPHIHIMAVPSDHAGVPAAHEHPDTAGTTGPVVSAYGLAPRYWRRQMAGETADEQLDGDEAAGAAAGGEAGEPEHLVDENTADLRHRIHDAEIAERQQARDGRRGRLLISAVVVLASVAVAEFSPWLW